MCDVDDKVQPETKGHKTVSVDAAVGMLLAHDITEIRPGEFKGRAFKKGHVVRQEDIAHLKRLGKERLFILDISADEVHEDEGAYLLAGALAGEGVGMEGEPSEGKINLVAEYDGLLKIDKEALTRFNMLADVMCATLHTDMPVKKGQVVAGTRVIPLIVKRLLIEEAVSIAQASEVVSVKKLRRPKTGVVITGSEVYYGRIKDAFGPVVKEKIEALGGEIVGMYYTPDDPELITARLNELVEAGADLLVTTGGMSVDPDDVTRFAVREIGAGDITYGTPVLPGSMSMVAYIKRDDGFEIPLIGIPACGIHSKNTVFDIILPRVLAGERITRREVAELGHGGLCMRCESCRFPACAFGKF